MSLDQPGSRRAIADLFVMFMAWTSQKASKVHKFCLKVGHSANLKRSKSPHEDNRPVTPVKCAKSAHRGTGTICDRKREP